jgi:hypothetical protein
MRFLRKLLGAALIGAGVVYLRGRRKALAMARGAEEAFDDRFGTSVPNEADMIEVATTSGIADVDPEPLSQVAGEGIDPVRDLAAHDDIKALRDRLPRRG